MSRAPKHGPLVLSHAEARELADDLASAHDIIRDAIRKIRRVAAILEEEVTDGCGMDRDLLRRQLKPLARARYGLKAVQQCHLKPNLRRMSKGKADAAPVVIVPEPIDFAARRDALLGKRAPTPEVPPTA